MLNGIYCNAAMQYIDMLSQFLAMLNRLRADGDIHFG